MRYTILTAALLALSGCAKTLDSCDRGACMIIAPGGASIVYDGEVL